jgi:hypothetical protein
MTPECKLECQKAEGNYDPIPRGVLMFESSTIQTDKINNPHIRLERNKEIQGEITAFNTYVK